MPFISSASATFSATGKGQPLRGTQLNPATSAVDLVQRGFTQDGPYWIKASPSAPAQQVYCILDPSWDGGGWMILAHNDAAEVLYTSAHRPRLTANSEWVGTSGVNSHNFTSKWSINAQDMQISKIAWCVYGVSTVPFTSWSRSSDVVTFTTPSPHGFSVGKVVRIDGSQVGADTINGHLLITSTPTSTSFTVDSVGSNTSTITPATSTFTLTNMSIDSSTRLITFTTSAVHSLLAGDVVEVSGLSSLYNSRYYVATTPSTTTFTVYTPQPTLGSTSVSGTVTRAPRATSINLNSRDIKNFSSYHYGQFNTLTYIPSSTTRNWTRLYDTFNQPLPWRSLNDIVMPAWNWTRTAVGDYFDSIYLYDGTPDTRSYTAVHSYNPLTILGTRNANSVTSATNDTNSNGVTSTFSFTDRGLAADPATNFPDGANRAGTGFDIRGLDDWQDGNSLGNGWGSPTGLLRYGQGAPSYIMVK